MRVCFTTHLHLMIHTLSMYHLSMYYQVMMCCKTIQVSIVLQLLLPQEHGENAEGEISDTNNSASTSSARRKSNGSSRK